jgi:hypothetical protein
MRHILPDALPYDPNAMLSARSIHPVHALDQR